MNAPRTAAVLIALAAMLSLPARQAASVGVGAPAWVEDKWPFPLDEWGTGRAWHCAAADCGVEVKVYLRAKIGFCNCATGVSDDAELDRVGDISLFGNKFAPLHESKPTTIGWMKGLRRLYDVAPPYAKTHNALAVAVNNKCDVVVATAVAGRDLPPEAEHATLGFLASEPVLSWAKAELGL